MFFFKNFIISDEAFLFFISKGLKLFLILKFNAFLIDLLIENLEISQLNTDGAVILPLCLAPIFTVGFLKDGTSIIPLDELPITHLDTFISEK